MLKFKRKFRRQRVKISFICLFIYLRVNDAIYSLVYVTYNSWITPVLQGEAWMPSGRVVRIHSLLMTAVPADMPY